MSRNLLDKLGPLDGYRTPLTDRAGANYYDDTKMWDAFRAAMGGPTSRVLELANVTATAILVEPPEPAETVATQN